MHFPPPTERQARIIWLAVTGLGLATLVALVAALIWGLGHVLRILSPVLWPVAVAGVLAYLLDPVVDAIEKRGTPRPRAIVTVFGLALFLVLGVIGSVVPQLVIETRTLASRVPAYANRLERQVQHWVDHPPGIVARFLHREVPSIPEAGPPTTNTAVAEGATNITTVPPPTPARSPESPLLSAALDKDNLQTATGWLAKVLPRIGSWLFGQVGRVASWFGVLAGLALIPVYTFYFLLEKQGISSRWTDYLPVADSALKDEIVFVLNSINNYLIAFFRGQVLVAICDGILYGLGFYLVGLPYALLIGAAAMVLTIIPFIGAIIVCTTALVIAVVQFGDWLHPLLVAGVFATVQVIEGLVVSPKIMGDRVGLHPVTIIIAVMVGTTLLGGLLGGILAIPLTAALRVVMFRYVWKRPATRAEAAQTANPAISP